MKVNEFGITEKKTTVFSFANVKVIKYWFHSPKANRFFCVVKYGNVNKFVSDTYDGDATPVCQAMEYVMENYMSKTNWDNKVE